VSSFGRSCHDEQPVEAAAVQTVVYYFCVGPTWPTPTKPEQQAPGLPLLRPAAALGTDGPGSPSAASTPQP